MLEVLRVADVIACNKCIDVVKVGKDRNYVYVKSCSNPEDELKGWIFDRFDNSSIPTDDIYFTNVPDSMTGDYFEVVVHLNPVDNIEELKW